MQDFPDCGWAGPWRAAWNSRVLLLTATALTAVGLLGEPFAAYHVVALVLVVGGVAIAQRAPRQRLAGAGRRDLSTGKAD